MTDEFEKQLDQVMGRIAFQIAAEIKREVPVDTGKLRNSIVATKDGDNWVVGTNLEYMEYIEFGTEPHEITPKDKKALYWNGAAHPVKKVMHPGTKGQFIFQKAAMKADKLIERELQKL